jgi:Uma2 family endonuclease
MSEAVPIGYNFIMKDASEEKMPHATRIMSADQLLVLPDDGRRYELVLGELRMMSPAGGRHGRIAQKLLRRLGNHVELHDLGETFAAETGFLLHTDPDTVRAPDVAYVSHARLAGRADHPGYLPLAPNLIAEVVSPTDSSSDVAEKAGSWLAAGVEIVLVVDPQNKTVCVYRPNQEIRIFSDGPIDLNAVVPGYHLDVAELFA